MNIYTVIEAVLPVVVMLCLGMLARRNGLFSQEGINGLRDLVMNFTLPAVVFSTLIAAQYEAGLLVLALTMLAFSLLSWWLGILLRKAMGGKPRLLPYITSGFEAGMLGYALYTILYGADNLFYMAVMDVGQMIFIFTLYLAALGAEQGEKKTVKETAVTMLKTPVLIATILGLIIGATGLGGAILGSPIGGTVTAVLSFIAAPTGAAILFVVGYGLDLANMQWGGALKAFGARLGIMLVLCGGMLLLQMAILPRSAALTAATILEFMLPVPYVLALGVKDDSEKTFVSSVISLSTLWTVVVFALLAMTRG